jgi:carbon-monoxide dehydrogenase medium subunit
MKPPPFDYHCPDSVEDVLALLGQDLGATRLLAGGQSLVPLLNQRDLKMDTLIDLNRVRALFGIEKTACERLRIGAMTRQSDLETSPLIQKYFPEISVLLPKLGFPATRHRGTVGGSIAWADPAAELPALALALGGSVELISEEKGKRLLPLDDFLVGPFSTAAKECELLSALHLPIRPHVTTSYIREVNVRETGRAIMGIIAFPFSEANDTHFEATLFGWNDRPRTLRVPFADQAADYVSFLNAFTEAWQTDPHGSRNYRQFLTSSLLHEASIKLLNA